MKKDASALTAGNLMPITESCGNVFLDLGFSEQEAAELIQKAVDGLWAWVEANHTVHAPPKRCACR